jgi:acyl-coenzyme A synthetase/AMP-(fatty) acid ligase
VEVRVADLEDASKTVEDDDLPKTSTGKIMRRELNQLEQSHVGAPQ